MNAIRGGTVERPNGGTPLSAAETRLKKTAVQMEGLFVQRLFAAMRDTVPEGGLIEHGNGEATFTSLLDEKVSEQVPAQWNGEHSLANALYNQLRQRLGSPADNTKGSESPR